MTRLPRAALWPAAAILFLAVGAAAYGLFAAPLLAQRIWLAGLILTGAPVVWRTARGALAGRWAADLVATLAIITAAAIDHPFPGLIIVLMQTGGEALERFAEGRASRAVHELEAMAPRTAHRMNAGTVTDVPVEQVRTGDRLLLRPGEMVPCDSVVVEGRSHIDTSRITGEPLPLTAVPGIRLLSGTLNQEGALTLQATAPAGESQYARIVELVRTAQASKSPFQRMADRYAIWFTPFTLAACVIAFALSGDWTRVLAVLVVATPCPLILAAPVAIIGGINRAAREMVVFRTGGALEQLGRVSLAAFDKTGTLTMGHPSVAGIEPVSGFNRDEVLRYTAALEQHSSHVLATPVVQAAAPLGPLPAARDVNEAPGEGISGWIEERQVTVGGWAFLEHHDPAAAAVLARRRDGDGLRAYVAIGGRAAGVITYADALRPGLPEFFAELHRLGLRRTILLSGDRQENASAVARSLGLDEARGNLLPAEKAALVGKLQTAGDRVVMLGDGTNDAPALSVARVGVALASGGGGITAEAADVVILADDPTRLATAINISRRTLGIARQSLWAGMGLSMVAMVFAGAGFIPPTFGALLQEAIDIAVIVNALRASVAGR